MRTVFHERLDELTAHLGEMCGLARAAMERATESLLQADLVAAEDVIAVHDRLAQMKRKAEERAIALLALQAPVARDLRAVVSSLQNAADAERMGGLASHVAEIVRRRHPAHVLPADVNGYFCEMGQVAVTMATSAQQVILSCDPRRAAQLRNQDDAMDDLHNHVLSVLMEREWTHGLESAVDVTLLARFYERFADHAVEIGRRVIFQASGQLNETAEPSVAD
jgi:phosphate transport system protein